MPSRLDINVDRAVIRRLSSSTTDQMGFFGATPTTRPAATAQSAVTTTNATTTTPWGYTTSGQANGIVTLLNQIRSDLVTLGLIKGSA